VPGAAMTATPHSPAPHSPAREKETILVVDDEASIRRILETRLSMIGYRVVTACDGQEALEAFHDHHPDLVVLDVMMPKLDGYGVCQELRASPAWSSAPTTTW
jgi:OmpR family response regulator RpaB